MPLYRMPNNKIATQNGLPVLLTQQEFEDCCCGFTPIIECYQEAPTGYGWYDNPTCIYGTFNETSCVLEAKFTFADSVECGGVYGNQLGWARITYEAPAGATLIAAINGNCEGVDAKKDISIISLTRTGEAESELGRIQSDEVLGAGHCDMYNHSYGSGSVVVNPTANAGLVVITCSVDTADDYFHSGMEHVFTLTLQGMIL